MGVRILAVGAVVVIVHVDDLGGQTVGVQAHRLDGPGAVVRDHQGRGAAADGQVAAAGALEREIGGHLGAASVGRDPHGDHAGGGRLEHGVEQGALGAPQHERGVREVDGRQVLDVLQVLRGSRLGVGISGGDPQQLDTAATAGAAARVAAGGDQGGGAHRGLLGVRGRPRRMGEEGGSKSSSSSNIAGDSAVISPVHGRRLDQLGAVATPETARAEAETTPAHGGERRGDARGVGDLAATEVRQHARGQQLLREPHRPRSRSRSRPRRTAGHRLADVFLPRSGRARSGSWGPGTSGMIPPMTNSRVGRRRRSPSTTASSPVTSPASVTAYTRSRRRPVASVGDQGGDRGHQCHPGQHPPGHLGCANAL